MNVYYDFEEPEIYDIVQVCAGAKRAGVSDSNMVNGHWFMFYTFLDMMKCFTEDAL